MVPGTYAVTADLAGFKATERGGVEVGLGAVLNLEMQLQVGNATESVGQVIDIRRINDLPLQACNAAELALLAPGVVNITKWRARKTSFNSASSQFSTNGNALYSQEYTIDGIPDTFPNNGTLLVAFQPPASAVSEFKVQTTAMDAGLGHTPESVLNLVTASGTNQFHGELH